MAIPQGATQIYRGYVLQKVGEVVQISTFNGDLLDSEINIERARAMVDSYVEGSVR